MKTKKFTFLLLIVFLLIITILVSCQESTAADATSETTNEWWNIILANAGENIGTDIAILRNMDSPGYSATCAYPVYLCDNLYGDDTKESVLSVCSETYAIMVPLVICDYYSPHQLYTKNENGEWILTVEYGPSISQWFNEQKNTKTTTTLSISLIKNSTTSLMNTDLQKSKIFVSSIVRTIPMQSAWSASSAKEKNMSFPLRCEKEQESHWKTDKFIHGKNIAPP